MQVFHATNFTETNETLSLDKLMKTSLILWEKLPFFKLDPKTAVIEDFSEVATRLADLHFEDLFKKERTEDLTTYSPAEITAWMLHATCCQWFGIWADLAFPRIQTSHSYAALLMSTTISAKEIAHVEAPWPGFLVEVPQGLLPLNLNGKETSITRVHVLSHFLPRTVVDEKWVALWMTGPGVEILRVGRLDEIALPRTKRTVSRTELVEVDAPRVDERDAPLDDESGDFDAFWSGYDSEAEERVAVLASRLVIGACIAMTDPTSVRERPVKIDPSVSPLARRLHKRPISRVFTVGEPIERDFRPAVAAYLGGERDSLKVQSLVAGHHKRQACGPNGADRKWVFIQPYWRGPEAAPILVREHVLSGGTNEQE